MTEQSINPGDDYPDLQVGDEVESDIDLDFDSFEVDDDGLDD